MSVSNDIIERAKLIGTASLHEAAGRKGALPHQLKPLDPCWHVAGRALPVRCPLGDNLFLHHAIDALQPGDVIVAEVGDGAGFGYWGDIMATAAKARGAAGLVITGGVRDSLNLIEIGLPIFSLSVAIHGTRKDRDGLGAVGEPVRIGEVLVSKGDLVVGDADGVTVFAQTQAAEVVVAAEGRDAAEEEIIRQVKAGASTLEVYKL